VTCLEGRQYARHAKYERRELTGQLVTVGWQVRIVTVVVVLTVSVSVFKAPTLKARTPRATRIVARIVDDDDWLLDECFGGFKGNSTTRLR
jgi:hypothetical protein